MPTFAAVDIGSNSVRLKISRLVHHRLVEIHEDREVTRLGESVFKSGLLSPEAIALTVKVLRRFHRAVQRARARPKVVIATSGTAESLATVAHSLYRTRSQRGLTVSRVQMRRIAKMLARLSVDERRKVQGIGLRRAEIIIAGAGVYAELLERCKLSGFRYSPLGLRDGLLAQVAAESDHATRPGKQDESERQD